MLKTSSGSLAENIQGTVKLEVIYLMLSSQFAGDSVNLFLTLGIGSQCCAWNLELILWKKVKYN